MSEQFCSAYRNRYDYVPSASTSAIELHERDSFLAIWACNGGRITVRKGCGVKRAFSGHRRFRVVPTGRYQLDFRYGDLASIQKHPLRGTRSWLHISDYFRVSITVYTRQNVLYPNVCPARRSSWQLRVAARPAGRHGAHPRHRPDCRC
jgi:hypothetical protein